MIEMKNNHMWPDFTGFNNYSVTRIIPKSYICGYCSNKVSSDKGYPIYLKTITEYDNIERAGSNGGVYICPECLQPTYFYFDNQIPGPLEGSEIEHLPSDLLKVYDEIRKSISSSCYTSAVLLSRKMLMNIAVKEGAKEGLRFVEYVNYLDDNKYTPPKSKDWVDSIRKKGNEATHEIKFMEYEDAKQLLIFLEMLLRFIYSFPLMV